MTSIFLPSFLHLFKTWQDRLTKWGIFSSSTFLLLRLNKWTAGYLVICKAEETVPLLFQSLCPFLASSNHSWKTFSLFLSTRKKKSHKHLSTICLSPNVTTLYHYNIEFRNAYTRTLTVLLPVAFFSTCTKKEGIFSQCGNNPPTFGPEWIMGSKWENCGGFFGLLSCLSAFEYDQAIIS